VTYRDLVARFVASQMARGLSKAWPIQARLTFDSFEALVQVDQARDLTEEHLTRFMLSMKASHLVAGTVYLRFRILRSMLRWATRQGHLVKDAGAGFENEKPPARITRFVPTVAQVQRLLETPDTTTVLGQRDRFFLELVYGTGLRRSEVLALQVHDVQWDRGLWVRRGKGQKDRLVPLGDRLLQRTRDYLDSTRPAFDPPATESALLLTRQGGKMLRSILAVRFRHYALKAELPRLSLHGLRHAFATHLLEGGAQLHEIRRLLGHSRLATTQLYTQLQPTELFRVYRRTHPRARRKR
jgi:integrase/recombinase XerD